MKIKLDENMPATLSAVLAARGHDTDTVTDEGLAGRPDTDVWEAAQRDDRFLITQDLDFSDARRFRPGTHSGLLLVRLSNPSRTHLIERVSAVFESERTDDWPGCFVVLTDRKVRVRRAGR